MVVVYYFNLRNTIKYNTLTVVTVIAKVTIALRVENNGRWSKKPFTVYPTQKQAIKMIVIFMNFIVYTIKSQNQLDFCRTLLHTSINMAINRAPTIMLIIAFKLLLVINDMEQKLYANHSNAIILKALDILFFIFYKIDVLGFSNTNYLNPQQLIPILYLSFIKEIRSGSPLLSNNQ